MTLTKGLVADFNSSMIEGPQLFVLVDIILGDVKRRRLPSAGPSDNVHILLDVGGGDYWATNHSQ